MHLIISVVRFVIDMIDINDNLGDKKMRNYTVTDDAHEHGAIFYHNGKKYQRSYMVGAIFDHEFAGEEMVNEYKAEMKKFKKNPLKYMRAIKGGK